MVYFWEKMVNIDGLCPINVILDNPQAYVLMMIFWQTSGLYLSNLFFTPPNKQTSDFER